MAVVDFRSVWEKVLDHVNNPQNGYANREATAKNGYMLSIEYMDILVHELLSDLEYSFMSAYYNEWGTRAYPFSGLFEESRVVCKKSSHGYDFIISFGGNDGELSRQSVLITTSTKRYRGKGIMNIISLFDTGFLHTSRVFGLWESKSRGFQKHIKVRNYAKGLNVISQTIDDFQLKYKDIGLTARLIAPNEYYAR